MGSIMLAFKLFILAICSSVVNLNRNYPFPTPPTQGTRAPWPYPRAGRNYPFPTPPTQGTRAPWPYPRAGPFATPPTQGTRPPWPYPDRRSGKNKLLSIVPAGMSPSLFLARWRIKLFFRNIGKTGVWNPRFPIDYTDDPVVNNVRQGMEEWEEFATKVIGED